MICAAFVSEEILSSLVSECCQVWQFSACGRGHGVLGPTGTRGRLMCLRWCSHPCVTAGWGAIGETRRGARSDHYQGCPCPQLSCCLILSEVGGSTETLLALRVIVPKCHTGGRGCVCVWSFHIIIQLLLYFHRACGLPFT